MNHVIVKVGKELQDQIQLLTQPYHVHLQTTSPVATSTHFLSLSGWCFLGSVFHVWPPFQWRIFFPISSISHRGDLSIFSFQVVVGTDKVPSEPLSSITFFTIDFKSDWFKTENFFVIGKTMHKDPVAWKVWGILCLVACVSYLRTEKLDVGLKRT